jgi:CRISPR/Cas system-associated endoribonuclease Cas2
MSIKPITQNPKRYTKEGTQWKVSAKPAIKPIYLPIGVPLNNLKPVLKGDGIVVKLGEDYLCSLQTLNDIKDSNNPHYDIIENGKLKVKDKEVVIGKTVKIIELDASKLQTIIQGRELQNRQSGVMSVSYIDDAQNGLIEGIPKKLIDQINYTLDKASERPSDKFEVVDYFSMVDSKNNPDASHYTIKPIRTVTDQQATIFDPKRLQTFIIELDNQLKLLRRDFNRIQDTFFKGELPTPNIYGLIIEDIVAKTDEDDQKSNHSVRIRESSELISVEPTPISNVTAAVEETKAAVEEVKPNLPVIKEYRLKRKRDGDRNGMGVINRIDKLTFSKGGTKLEPKSVYVIREGQTFSGYVFKKVVNGKYTLWALSTDPNVPPTEWAYQGPGDDVELIS